MKGNPSFIDPLHVVEKQFGEDFMKQLASQSIQYYSTFAELGDKLAAGEVAVAYAPLTTLETQRLAGKPVDWIKVSDSNIRYRVYMGWSGCKCPSARA